MFDWQRSMVVALLTFGVLALVTAGLGLVLNLFMINVWFGVVAVVIILGVLGFSVWAGRDDGSSIRVTYSDGQDGQ